MKKLLLGLMILGSINAFAQGEKTDIGKKEGTVKMKAYSLGALNLKIENNLIDFGNLRIYNGQNHSVKCTISDSSLLDGQNATVHIQTKGESKLKLEGGNSYILVQNYLDSSNGSTDKNVELKGSEEAEFNVYAIIQNKEKANEAPAGQYKGSFEVTAFYDI
ncbi:MAG: hypothetical protein MJH09_06350 [Cetobacterium sp.]|nr:hypothetical protein [Cetobacterium sp.]